MLLLVKVVIGTHCPGGRFRFIVESFCRHASDEVFSRRVSVFRKDYEEVGESKEGRQQDEEKTCLES